MKKNLNRLFMYFCLMIVVTAVFADKPTTQQIERLGINWAQALSERNPEKIAALYDKDALLYATFANKIDSHEGILKYFSRLMENNNLKVNFTQQNIRTFEDVALNSGLYVFSYTQNGKVVSIPARYTFVYYKTPTGWKIIDHHSSSMPEGKK